MATLWNYVKPGESVRIRLPYSEVCMHMQVAGKRMLATLLEGHNGRAVVQLYTETAEYHSAPILPGEAGFYQDERGWYHPHAERV